MPIKRQSRSNKNPPFFSHEFFIQNHADIVSCVAMVFVLGLLFQVSSSVASMFVVMSHNTTDTFAHDQPTPVLYTYGAKDVALTFFYFLICIVMHAVIQEYLLDKLNRKLHLSKIKFSKFNESGQLLIFYLISVVWGGEIIRRENLFASPLSLWTDYPHSQLPYLFKFYFIIQIAYWLHAFPELYFQKVKKDEITTRVTYSSLYLIFFTAGYLLNLSRFAVVLSVLHYATEALFHLSRLFYFADKPVISGTGFKVWNVLFVLVRLASISLSVLTFFFGLAQTAVDVIAVADGNFNTALVRINCLTAVSLLQAWMMWNFINFHLKRRREKNAELNALKKKAAKKAAPGAKKKVDDDVSELPEVDQNTKITQRKTVKAKH